MVKLGFYRISLLFVITLMFFSASGQGYYWVQFADKKGTTYSIDKPEQFLSARAIERRQNQQIAINETDLPVSKPYLDQLKALGFKIVHTSKWLNGCTVQTNNSSLIQQLSGLSFVTSWQLTKPVSQTKSAIDKFNETEVKVTAAIDTSYYGAASHQIGLLNGQALHRAGYRGKGIQIAVLDNGFLNVNTVTAFDSIRNNHQILGTRDFVSPGSNVYQSADHGTKVLSTMAANIRGQIIGAAVDAGYYLIRTEDSSSEYIIEEDNWVAGAEYADSLGVDIINSSLGYSIFNDTGMNHTYQELNGNTTRVTRGANMAARKGILVVCSAGNEGNKTWKYIGAPSDGENVIGVASVESNGTRSVFSSMGFETSAEVKPNVAAMGSSTALIGPAGTIVFNNGTSFSSPLIAGMAACLWQANPDASAAEVKRTIEKSGSQYFKPDNLLGYGIPDFAVANVFLKSAEIIQADPEQEWLAYPNPVTDQLSLSWLKDESFSECRVQVFSTSGAILYDQVFAENNKIVLKNLSNLPPGLLFLKIISEEKTTTLKIIKTSR